MADHTRVTHVRTRLALSLLAAWTLLAAVPAVSRAERLVVQRDPGLTAAQRADVRADAGVRLAATLPVADTEVVTVPADDADRALARLNRDPRVSAAAPDLSFHVADARPPDPPNDTYWPNQWGMAASPGVDAEEAWQYSDGLDTTVAVVDTGVDSTQEDLAGQVRTDGHNYVDKNDDTHDANGHGTMVAGVVAATADNGAGIAGLAPEAQILPLRAFLANGDADFGAVLAAFDDAGKRGIPVVSASFSSDPADAVPAAAKMIQNTLAAHPDTLYVVAAGNDGVDVDAPHNTVYPCDVTSPNLICVGAYDDTDNVASFSNFGATSVDLFAPGAGIYTTLRGNQYYPQDGTSFAVPFVSAEAALLFSRLPQMTADQAKAVILGSVRPSPVYGQSVSGGAEDAGAALDATLLDTDGDTVPDVVDNCASLANPDQADADGDGQGDACDTTPRGADPDGDGVGALDDHCSTQPGPAGNFGCPLPVTATPTPPPVVTPTPTPTPTPTVTPVVPLRIVSVSVKVAHSRKTARVTVRLTRTAGTQVTVERRSGHRWTRIARRSFSATARGRALTVRTSRRGSYRVTVTLAGAKTVRHSFRV
jgi:subtilisin family serine protease